MAISTTGTDVFYPETDGKPMAENTRQYRWIVTLQGNLELLFRERPLGFVAGDLLWYPVEGRADRCTAPDVMVVLNRPAGDRGSYRQWLEENQPPQVVFEILSPGNRTREMALKFDFYEQYGVEEYYIYNPDTFDLGVWVRQADRLRIADYTAHWTSPLLHIRFSLTEGQDMRVYYPDGSPFLTFIELGAARQRAEQERAQAEQERDRERDRAERLAARLRELGIDPEGMG